MSEDWKKLASEVAAESDPSPNGHLHYPNGLDGRLNEAAAD